MGYFLEFCEAIKKELLSKRPLCYAFGAMAKGDRKSPSDAALLGILIVGLGHFYLGMWGKGIGLILLTIIATLFLKNVFVAPVFWIISCVWAYYDAKSYNREWGHSDFGGEKETDDDVEEETEGDKFCSNCGKPLLQDDNFCPGCRKSTVRAASSAKGEK